MKLNGFNTEYQPQLAHGGVKNVDLAALGDFINKLSSSGMEVFPDGKLEDHLYKVANLPRKEV